jgi:hypothetical protein
MELKKIRVDAVLFFNNGARERKEFEFEKLGQKFKTKTKHNSWMGLWKKI